MVELYPTYAEAIKVIGQQVLQIQKLEADKKELQVLGRAERDNAQEGWDLAESYNIKIEELKEELEGLTKD